MRQLWASASSCASEHLHGVLPSCQSRGEATGSMQMTRAARALAFCVPHRSSFRVSSHGAHFEDPTIASCTLYHMSVIECKVPETECIVLYSMAEQTRVIVQ